MTISMCLEALSFSHDQDLVGYCLDDPNEPAGDDYETRWRKRMSGVVADPVGFVTNEDHSVDTGEEFEGGSYDFEVEELTGMHAAFCRMTQRQQNKLIWALQSFISRAVCGESVSVAWEPSENFVLDMIQDELSIEQVLLLAKDEYAKTVRYSATKTAPSSARADASLDDTFDDSDEAMDTYLPAQAGGRSKSQYAELAMENVHRSRLKEIAKDSGDHWRTRAKVSNERRKRKGLTKESVRIDAPHYFGFAGKGDGFEEYVEHIDAFDDMQNTSEETPWWACEGMLRLALWETESHDEYLYREYGVELVNVHRMRASSRVMRHYDLDCFDDSYYDDRRDHAFDGYGPDERIGPISTQHQSWFDESSDDDRDYWYDGPNEPYWDMVQASAGSARLVRRGTPRHVMRRF